MFIFGINSLVDFQCETKAWSTRHDEKKEINTGTEKHSHIAQHIPDIH